MKNEIMTQVLFATAIIPFVVGFLEVVKRLAALPKNYIPLIEGNHPERPCRLRILQSSKVFVRSRL
ncbi:hypothetical protein [Halobacillus sp. H74]|uniref:hypothetical protein n=1 Tax=Halobacillus sp. H74 TaxID=3457436 RepID=UPI003FCCD314